MTIVLLEISRDAYTSRTTLHVISNASQIAFSDSQGKTGGSFGIVWEWPGSLDIRVQRVSQQDQLQPHQRLAEFSRIQSPLKMSLAIMIIMISNHIDYYRLLCMREVIN